MKTQEEIRNDFEAWYYDKLVKTANGRKVPPFNTLFSLNRAGSYINPSMQRIWHGWLAAAQAYGV